MNNINTTRTKTFSIKVVDTTTEASKGVSWVIVGNKWEFTKSKAEFILQAAVKRNIFPNCLLKVVAN